MKSKLDMYNINNQKLFVCSWFIIVEWNNIYRMEFPILAIASCVLSLEAKLTWFKMQNYHQDVWRLD